MILLASFPRSGNTYVRNILYEVFGLESCTYHHNADRIQDSDYQRFPVVKTHLLPDQLPADLASRPVVYLIRDARDAHVSMAHHRSDIVAPGSDYEHNLIESILAHDGSFFGGWSKNVGQWSKKAQIIIRFEDLIRDPIGEISKLKKLLRLPSADLRKLPTFEQLKYGNPKYGGTYQNRSIASQNFRRGIIGSWKDEMPVYIERLLVAQHHGMLCELGYIEEVHAAPERPRRVLIEASKFLDSHYDGISRYVSELIHHYPRLLNGQNSLEIDLQIGAHIYPLVGPGLDVHPSALREQILQKQALEEEVIPEAYSYEKKLLLVKKIIRYCIPQRLYVALSTYYAKGPFRSYLTSIRRYALKRSAAQSEEKTEASIQAYDLCHAPLPQNLAFLVGKGKRALVTIHDMTHLTHPSFHLEDNLNAASLGMQLAKEIGSAYIVISENTKRDLIKQVKEGIIYNIPQGIHPGRFHPSVRAVRQSDIDEKYGLPDTFIFCLSTIEPRKNLTTTIEAFLKLIEDPKYASIHLVIGGKAGWQCTDVFEYTETSRIQFSGYIDDEDLPYLYGRATIFSYVSHYEGFGLPLIEAMGCGTPVVYGANSAMNEIVFDHGLGCDPQDSDTIKKAYARILSSDQDRNHYAKKSRACASKYTWLKTALKTLEVYEKLISQSV